MRERVLSSEGWPHQRFLSAAAEIQKSGGKTAFRFLSGETDEVGGAFSGDPSSGGGGACYAPGGRLAWVCLRCGCESFRAEIRLFRPRSGASSHDSPGAFLCGRGSCHVSGSGGLEVEFC